MQKIMITGFKGQLGAELTRQFKQKYESELILTDVDSLDITDMDSVYKMIQQTKPQVIINCAAHTAVDLCESDQENAFKINAIGARNLAIASHEINAKILHVSTDYVFNGTGKKNTLSEEALPYIEFDAPDPQTIYGLSKLEGERLVQTMNPRHFIIRTAWLYGEGNNFVRTMLKLAKEQSSLKVVNDQYGTPTSTVELARLILFMIKTDNYGLFHGTCEGQCTWYDFAKQIFAYANIDIDVVPVTTREFPRPAKRPQFSVLDNFMLRLTSDFKFLDWKEALKKYLDKEKVK